MGKFTIEFEEEDGVLAEKELDGTEAADAETLAKKVGVSRIDAESCE